MKRAIVYLAGWLLFVAATVLLHASGQQARGEEGFVPLFNGKDLSGWVNVNCYPDTFQVRNGVIVCTGKPNGFIRTEKMYENFILELEWKHLDPKGNAGLFIWADGLPAPGYVYPRSIEVQVMVGRTGKKKIDGKDTVIYTSQGDVFAIQGATLTPDRPHPLGWDRCLPSENRCKGAGHWNHYRIVCKDGRITLAVNGKVVSGGTNCSPRKGYICLEAEGTEVHFRNIRIKELPSTHPKPQEVAFDATGFVPLYNRRDLNGWKHEKGHLGHWQPRDHVLHYDGKSTAKDRNLWSEKDYKDFTLVVDWRFVRKKPHKRLVPKVLPDGTHAKDKNGKEIRIQIDDYGDSGIYLRGSSKSQVNIWCWPIGSGEVYGYRMDRRMPPEVRAGVTPKLNADNPPGRWNRFIITMKGDRLTVLLNGKKVLDGARLPGVKPTGPIALQHHGDPIQFANIYIKELD